MNRRQVKLLRKFADRVQHSPDKAPCRWAVQVFVDGEPEGQPLRVCELRITACKFAEQEARRAIRQGSAVAGIEWRVVPCV